MGYFPCLTICIYYQFLLYLTIEFVIIYSNFKWALKVIWECIDYALLLAMIDWKKSSRQDTKLQTIMSHGMQHIQMSNVGDTFANVSALARPRESGKSMHLIRGDVCGMMGNFFTDMYCGMPHQFNFKRCFIFQVWESSRCFWRVFFYFMVFTFHFGSLATSELDISRRLTEFI